MRKVIIDTDTGSDDAAAIMLAVAAADVEILGVTTLGGNIALEQTTKNALQTLEVCGSDTPVYPGACRPIMRELVTADGVHGKDRMGDQDLVHPVRKAESRHAVDFILETVRKYPDEIEIIALGPATNIALAIMQDRETMSRVKHIWSMGTSGFGVGNCTPVAEFNVYVDADSYAIMLTSGIPVTIIGFDLCLGPAAMHREDLDYLKTASAAGEFAVKCTTALLNYNLQHRGECFVDLPDAVAMGIALWPDIVEDYVDAYCYCCTKEEPAYGQVIIYDVNQPLSIDYKIPPANAQVIRRINYQEFKNRFKASLARL